MLRIPPAIFAFVCCRLLTAAPTVYVAPFDQSFFDSYNSMSGQSTARRGIDEGAHQFVLSPDGSIAYVAESSIGSTTGTQVIDVATGRVLATLNTVSDAVYLKLDGSVLYALVNNSLTGMSSVKAFSTSSYQQIGVAQLRQNESAGIVASADGSRIYVSSSTGIAVVDGESYKTVAMIAVGDAQGMAITADGSKLFVASSDGKNIAYVVDTTSNVVISAVPPYSPGQLGVQVALSSDELYLFEATSQGLAKIATASSTISADVATPPISTISLSSDGHYAYSAIVNVNSVPGVLKFDIAKASPTVQTFRTTDTVADCKPAPGGSAFYTLENIPALYSVDGDSGAVKGRALGFSGNFDLTVARGGSIVAGVSYGNSVTALNTALKTIVQTPFVSSSENVSLAVTNDGALAFIPSGRSPVNVAVFNLASGQHVTTIPIPDKTGTSTYMFLSMAPDDSTVYVLVQSESTESTELCKIDVATLTVTTCRSEDPGSLEALGRVTAVSQDGSKLYIPATVAGEQGIQELDTATLTSLRSVAITSFGIPYYSFAYSGADQAIFFPVYDVFNSMNANVIKLDLASFSVSGTSPAYHFDPTDIAVSEDGASVYVATENKTSIIMDAVSLMKTGSIYIGTYQTSIASW